MLLLTIFLGFITFSESSSSSCENYFTTLSNDLDNISQTTNLQTSRNFTLLCAIKNVTLIKSPADTYEYILYSNQIDWAVGNCLDFHTLIFTTDGPPKSEPTGTDFFETQEIVVSIQCVSVSKIVFEFEGYLPQWDTIVEHDYNPESDVYLSTVYIPYTADKTGNYTFRTASDNLSRNYTDWFYIYFAGADHFVPNPWRTSNLTLMTETIGSNVLVPCRVTHPQLSEFVKLQDPDDNEICINCNMSSKGIEISDINELQNLRTVKYLNCIIGNNSRNGSNLKILVGDESGNEPHPMVRDGGISKFVFKGDPHLVCINSENAQWENISIVYSPRITEAKLRRGCLDETVDCSGHGVSLYGAVKNVKTCSTGETCGITVETFESGIVRCGGSSGNYTSERNYFMGLDKQIYFVNNDYIPTKALATISRLSTGRIFCSVVNYLYMPGFKFKLFHINGTLEEKTSETAMKRLGILHSGEEVHSEWLDGIVDKNVKRVVCEIRSRLPNQDIQVFAERDIENGSVPKVLSFAVYGSPYMDNTFVFLNCSASGSPKPEIHFKKGDKRITGVTPQNDWNATENILFSSVVVDMNAEDVFGVYSCVSQNMFGLNTRRVEINERDHNRAAKCRKSSEQDILDIAYSVDRSPVMCSERLNLSCDCTCRTNMPLAEKCQCPAPGRPNTEEYIMWPSFLISEAIPFKMSKDVCHLTGYIDCSNQVSDTCSTMLTSDVEGILTHKMQNVPKRWIKPLQNSTQRVCSLRRTISDTLCEHNAEREIIQQQTSRGFEMLFDMDFTNLICSCNAVIRHLENRKVDLSASENSTDTRTYTITIFGLMLMITILGLFGYIIYKRYLKTRTAQPRLHEKDCNVEIASQNQQKPSLPMSPLKEIEAESTSIWKSHQPLQLLSKTPLGSGCFGHVYKAKHLILNELMAVKHIVLYKALQACSWKLEILFREVKHMCEVDNCNVVKFYNCWIEGPKGMVDLVDCIGISQLTSTNEDFSIFIQMEYCDSTLDTWLKTRQAKEDRKDDGVVPMFKQILLGLDAIHQKNIVHRDIKPNNIFYKELNDRKIWKVGDLGLSKKIIDGLEEEPDVMSHVGNIIYRSPEMSKEINYTYKTDIYSMGLVFLEILIPDLINTAKKVEVFKRIRESENLGNYLPTLLGTESENVVFYEMLEGMLDSTSESRTSINEALMLLNGIEQKEFAN